MLLKLGFFFLINIDIFCIYITLQHTRTCLKCVKFLEVFLCCQVLMLRAMKGVVVHYVHTVLLK